MSQTAKLLQRTAQDVGYDPALLKAAVRPDDINIVHFEDDGGVAVRTRQHITGEGGTQGGTRLIVVSDGQIPDIYEAIEHSYDLSGVMTFKTGNIQAALIRAYEKDPKRNAWFHVPKTGGAKGVLMMRSSHNADQKKRDEHLREFVRGHLKQLQAGDGIGPDMGVTSAMMRTMGDEAGMLLGKDFGRQFTNQGAFPGRDESTGRYAVAAVSMLAKDLPVADRTHVIQGIGSAGGHFARILENEYYQSGHRVLAVGDKDRGLVARNKTKGLRWDIDYKVDQTGTITWWDEKTARKVGADQILFVPAGVKTLAAIGGVVNPGNYREILGEDSKQRTRVIIEIANMGIDPGTAEVIERTTDVLIGAAPFVSAGGVVASLWERYEPLLQKRLGRKVVYKDVARALNTVAECNCEAVRKEAAADGVGLYEAAHRLGFRQHFIREPLMTLFADRTAKAHERDPALAV